MIKDSMGRLWQDDWLVCLLTVCYEDGELKEDYEADLEALYDEFDEEADLDYFVETLSVSNDTDNSSIGTVKEALEVGFEDEEVYTLEDWQNIDIKALWESHKPHVNKGDW